MPRFRVRSPEHEPMPFLSYVRNKQLFTIFNACSVLRRAEHLAVIENASVFKYADYWLLVQSWNIVSSFGLWRLENSRSVEKLILCHILVEQ